MNKYLLIYILRSFSKSKSLEKISEEIGTQSFFEMGNILGEFKKQGYIDFDNSIGSISNFRLLDKAKTLLHRINLLSQTKPSKLDIDILTKIQQGNKDFNSLLSFFQIDELELAIHLSSLVDTGFLIESMKDKQAHFSLTVDAYNFLNSKSEQDQKLSTNEQEAIQEKIQEKEPKQQLENAFDYEFFFKISVLLNVLLLLILIGVVLHVIRV